MEAIGTLAGGIAHEFNNVLGIILGNAELALDDVPLGTPPASPSRK
jgi:two-component system cell cycle sensor histidine kinase/response regulator CckA